MTKQRRLDRTFRLLVAVLPLFLCHCHLWSSRTMLKEARSELQQAESSCQDEAALYHLEAAKCLLVAAEKQYEDADFGACRKFALRALEQIERAERLQTFHDRANGSESGDAP